MFQQYSIKKILNIKDKNITFANGEVKTVENKGIFYHVFQAKLTYDMKICPCCRKNKIIKYGFKNTTIDLDIVCGYKVKLCLKKQRFLCKNCQKTFIAETNLIKKYCSISENLKQRIRLALKKNISEKTIAEMFFVSHNTVHRIVDEAFHLYKPNFRYLPPQLSFDEFKSTKDADGAMSFVYCDCTKGIPIDILPGRTLRELREYFYQYPRKVREKVKNVVVDMYEPYIILIKELFPKAKISIDRFHLVQLINRSLNKTRIRIMNKHRYKNGRLYNKLKAYWKLLLLDASKLSNKRERAGRLFNGNFMSQNDIIRYLLAQDEELSNCYWIYQELLYAINNRDIDRVIYILRKKHENISKEMRRSLRTYRKYLIHIKNSLRYNFSNGVIEGVNNKIKTIKKTAYGFKSFFHFRNRILNHFNILSA